MERTVDNDIATILQYARKKRDRFVEILGITKKQTEALSQQSTDKLMEYIQEKQQHIDAINRLDEKFNSLYDNIRQRLDGAAAGKDSKGTSDYNCLVEVISDIRDLMKQIYAIEQKNNEMIASKVEGLKQKIQDVNLQKKSRVAYNQEMETTGGVFIDNKS
ncbi:MAG TPA: flagellar protein FlgN [Clostridiales bacterium]|nr:flagellar protein FlgN [Clostridiales bacterium]